MSTADKFGYSMEAEEVAAGVLALNPGFERNMLLYFDFSTGQERRPRIRLNDDSAIIAFDLSNPSSYWDSIPTEKRVKGAACPKLRKLPESVSGLKSIQKLNLEGCRDLEAVPAGIGSCPSLEVLGLRKCTNLASLPESLGQLTHLKSLDVSGDFSCVMGIRALPQRLAELQSLKSLSLSWCDKLELLPADFGSGLVELTDLNLSFCEQLQELPVTINGLRKLETLHLFGCKSLVLLPVGLQLPALKSLDMRDCPAILNLVDRNGLTAQGCEILTSGAIENSEKIESTETAQHCEMLTAVAVEDAGLAVEDAGSQVDEEPEDLLCF